MTQRRWYYQPDDPTFTLPCEWCHDKTKARRRCVVRGWVCHDCDLEMDARELDPFCLAADAFDQWFGESGHKRYVTRARALVAWEAGDIQGLPPRPR